MIRHTDDFDPGIIDGAIIDKVICQACGIDITSSSQVSAYCGIRRQDCKPVVLLVCPACGAYNETELDKE
jgi:hypothetical protein